MMFCKTIKIQSSIHLQQEVYDYSLGLWLWLSDCVGPQNNSASVLTGCCETLRMCVPWDHWNERSQCSWNEMHFLHFHLPFTAPLFCQENWVVDSQLGCFFSYPVSDSLLLFQERMLISMKDALKRCSCRNETGFGVLFSFSLFL